MKLITTFSLVALLTITACGGKSKSSSANGPQDETQPQTPDVPEIEEDISEQLDALIEGQHLAVFETLNLAVSKKLTGAFTFSREKGTDEMVGDVRLTNAGPGLLHAQYVRVGSRCPSIQDDTNQDGIIDAVEGEAVYGKVLFPLDGDLSSQSGSAGYFPVGDKYGNYNYSEVASFKDFMLDLREKDSNDGYYKLPRNQPLNIEGRVVVVHGVEATTVLPETVRTLGRLANHQTLPIVCGIVKKVTTVPGTVDEIVIR